MGGYGSGRNTGRATVEQALGLDIDRLMRRGVIQVDGQLGGEMRLTLYDDDIAPQATSTASSRARSQPTFTLLARAVGVIE
jgi:hypothetical protein